MASLDTEMMAFAVPFIIFAADLWLNSPVAAPLKHAGLAVSVAAVPLGRFEGFVAAELLWLVLLLLSMATAEEGAAATPAKGGVEGEKAPEEAAGPPALPNEGLKRMKEAIVKVCANLNESTNCDGKPWKEQVVQDGIRVLSSEMVGNSAKRWKVETVIKGAPLDELLEELFDFDRRVGANGWDTAIKEGKILETFKGDQYSMARMITNAAAGGAVSSREFIDLRAKFKGGEHESAPDGGILIANVGLNPKKDKSWLPSIPNADKSLVLGCNFPGTGIQIAPVPGKPNTFKYTMVSSMNLNGWIPSSVINTATSSALLESHQAMQAHLAKKFS